MYYGNTYSRMGVIPRLGIEWWTTLRIFSIRNNMNASISNITIYNRIASTHLSTLGLTHTYTTVSLTDSRSLAICASLRSIAEKKCHHADILQTRTKWSPAIRQDPVIDQEFRIPLFHMLRRISRHFHHPNRVGLISYSKSEHLLI